MTVITSHVMIKTAQSDDRMLIWCNKTVRMCA